MPSGGYGIDPQDMENVSAALNDESVKEMGMEAEWCATYATARANGATPDQARHAAYVEWDL